MLPDRMEAVRDWLHYARLDETSADRLLFGDAPVIESALFHCQQLAEKALKAYLVYLDRPFRWTHDLAELVQLCAAADPSFLSLAPIADDLTPFATRSRYPSQAPTPSPQEAQQRLVWARQVLAFVLDRLPPDLR